MSPHGYDQVTGRHFELITTRIHWMRLPIIRMMMQLKYVYHGNGKMNFETIEMKRVLRYLDFCQKEGISVILA